MRYRNGLVIFDADDDVYTSLPLSLSLSLHPLTKNTFPTRVPYASNLPIFPKLRSLPPSTFSSHPPQISFPQQAHIKTPSRQSKSHICTTYPALKSPLCVCSDDSSSSSHMYPPRLYPSPTHAIRPRACLCGIWGVGLGIWGWGGGGWDG